MAENDAGYVAAYERNNQQLEVRGGTMSETQDALTTFGLYASFCPKIMRNACVTKRHEGAP